MDLSKLYEKDINYYLDILKEYGKRVNIISKKITDDQLNQLIAETILMEKLVSGSIVVDAGSGNGILGIPVAVLNPDKTIFLIEPRKKKAEFLIYAVRKMMLSNVGIVRSNIEDFFKTRKKSSVTLLARGFPDNTRLSSYVGKKLASELILITSEDKIKKMQKGIEKLAQKTYNVPFRDNLKIIHITDVSRETQRENG